MSLITGVYVIPYAFGLVLIGTKTACGCWVYFKAWPLPTKGLKSNCPVIVNLEKKERKSKKRRNITKWGNYHLSEIWPWLCCWDWDEPHSILRERWRARNFLPTRRKWPEAQWGFTADAAGGNKEDADKRLGSILRKKLSFSRTF